MNQSQEVLSTELYNIDAEIEFLGMLIQDNNRMEDVDDFSAGYFYLPIHTEIFDTVKHLINKKYSADILNISSHLANSKDFLEIGGKDYILKIRQTVSYATIKARSELIYSLWLKRKLIKTGQEIVDSGVNATFLDIKNSILEAEAKIYGLSLQNERGGISNFESLTDFVIKHFDEARKNERPITGIPSHFNDLDFLLGGFKKTDLIIVAARPSMGKTAFAVNIAYNVAKQKLNHKSGGVALFSLEMSAEQITSRVVAIHTDQNSRILDTGRYADSKRFGQVSDYDFGEIRDSVLEIKDLPLFIDDSAVVNISTIHSRARRLKRRHDIDMIVIDYLQLIKGVSLSNNINRTQEISEVTQGLKAMAKELGIPIIALSQLSRAVESREDKRPQLSDLRESGAIEQDADIVMFLYREAYYLERIEPERVTQNQPVKEHNESQEEFQKKLTKWGESKVKHEEWFSKYQHVSNVAEVLVAKNRNGPIGNVTLAFEREKTKFYNRQSGDYSHNKKKIPQISVNKDILSSLSKEAEKLVSHFSDEEMPF